MTVTQISVFLKKINDRGRLFSDMPLLFESI